MQVPNKISVLATLLSRRQLELGGWPFFRSKQASIESTCLALLALVGVTHDRGVSATGFLMKCQLSDGSWPAFWGDREGTWTTSLAISTLISLNDASSAG